MIASGLFYSMLLFAAADWAASWREWQKPRLVTKPVTLLLLIAWFSLAGRWEGLLVWFGLGLVFSMLGDIFLMWPNRLFLAGMGAFFLAHVCYIGGFAQEELALNWLAIIPAAGVPLVYLLYLRRIRAGLRAQNQMEMNLPVSAYALILSLMLLFALSTLFRPAWQANLAMMASLGAALFFVSDALIAYDRFVLPVHHCCLLVMLTYHLGQILIAAAAIAQYAF